MTKRKQRKASREQSREPVQLSFMEHVRELRGRLFWTAIWFVAAAGALFPFYHDLIKLLMHPLGDEKLYYLSPMGGLSFAVKICMYVGLILTLPVLIYHLYRFIAPAMPKHRARTAITYVTLSILLAITGIAFAYTVSLPSAIHFLTNFELGNVSAMLTVDAYLSFIVTYLATGAILFQLPLIMVIIDTITPTPPSKWNRFQRHVIVAALVIAMLITPVPDITNQFILAAPMVLMYQIGIGLVWIRHRAKRLKRTPAVTVSAEAPSNSSPELAQVLATPLLDAGTPAPSLQPTAATAARSIDGVMRQPRPTPSVVVPNRSVDGVMRAQQPAREERPAVVQERPQVRLSIDGFIPAR